MAESAQGEVKSSVRTLQILKATINSPTWIDLHRDSKKYLEIPKSSLFVLLINYPARKMD